MLKNLSPTKKIFGMLIAIILFFTIIMMAISGNKVSQNQKKPPQFLSDNASADNKVEALKTMTANLVAVQDKNLKLEQEITELKNNNQKNR